jgi:hypothetical protein
MSRARLALPFLAAVLLAAAPLALAAQDAVMKLADPKVFNSPSRPPVRFTHAGHQWLEGVTCLTCHHSYKNGENVLTAADLDAKNPAIACASCHTTPRALQAAFHVSCITCHDAEKRKGRITGPRTCGECHVGKS